MTGLPVHGVLVVDKPEGPTSHDVVATARRALATREVGHTGTLDPMATGVLALVVGRATRLAQFLSGGDKVYDARVRLGVTTDTWDRTGAVLAEAAGDRPLPSLAAVTGAACGLLGEREQAPPPYSAKKVGGTPAYALARRGRDVEIRPVRVTLHAIDITAFEPPFVGVRLRCSGGYYVRALAQELGRLLGCGACLHDLRRQASGEFDLDWAVSLELLVRDPAEAVSRLIPVEALLGDWPAVALNDAGARRAGHGNEIGPDDVIGQRPPGGGPVRLFGPDGGLLAIAEPADRPGFLHPRVVLK